MSSNLLEDDEFRAWVFVRAVTLTPKEMVIDDYFVARLTKDIIFGRSKTFNKKDKKGSDEAGGVSFLYREFMQQRKEVNMISDKWCGCSEKHLKYVRNGTNIYKCIKCGHESTQEPFVKPSPVKEVKKVTGKVVDSDEKITLAKELVEDTKEEEE